MPDGRSLLCWRRPGMRQPQPSFYLIRPDGYIGLCGTRLDAGGVRNYVSQNVHLSV